MPANTIGMFPSATRFSALLQAFVQAISLQIDPSPEDWGVRTEHYFRRYVKGLRVDTPFERGIPPEKE